jgi:hypothetical protein
MSEAEIHYLVPEESRRHGDTELIVNAIRAFRAEQPFPIDLQYEQKPSEAAGGAAFIKFIRKMPEQKYVYELLEKSEDMRRGVEKHFPEEDRTRLSKHFVGIDKKDALESE